MKDLGHGNLHSSFAKDITLSEELVIVGKAEFSEKGLNVFRHTAVVKMSHTDALTLV